MPTAVTTQLAKLADALETLPEDAQAEVLAEIEARVDSLTQSRLTDEQRAIVRERLAAPREYASTVEVAALLRRFNPAL
jgi:Mg/Co/Ni transporter MgtE